MEAALLKKVIQHVVFAHNTQGHFLNKTENMEFDFWNPVGTLYRGVLSNIV